MTETSPQARLETTGELRQHLRAQYEGVLDDRGIERHIHDYVGLDTASGLVDMVRRQTGLAGRWLDVGSGYGSFVLAARARGIDARGIELEPFEVSFARARLKDFRPSEAGTDIYAQGSALALPWLPSEFDVVTLWNVLEHVPDADAALTEAIRVLKPGGVLYIVCPNYAAIRREAHYHVLWPSLLPRRAASMYLRWRGRNPSFFERHIFYRTNTAVTRFLRRHGMTLFDLRTDRFTRPETINHPFARGLFQALERAGFLPLVSACFQLALRNPLKCSVALYARKPAAPHEPINTREPSSQ